MKFGPVPLADALGAVLAHSVATPSGRLRKGHVIDAAALDQLAKAGLRDVIVARLGPDDVSEDDAAARLAKALAGPGLDVREAFTGRANLHATGAGVLGVDAQAIAAANAVHPMITIATLPEWQRVTPGMMAATVKIIAYGVPEEALAKACRAAKGAMRVHGPAVTRAELIVTTLQGAPTGTEAVLERLARFGVECTVTEVAHDRAALARALADGQTGLRLILTASATSDPDDVGPGALRDAGGALTRFGMPVDPGNLLFIGALGAAHVIGLPGCARSPALNGADWVLERVICGVPVGDADIAAMGVGGLLKEIPTRPQPRDRARK